MKSRVYFNSESKAKSFATKTESKVEVLANSVKGQVRSEKHNNAKFAVIPQTKSTPSWQKNDNSYCDFGEGYKGKESEITEY